MQDPHEADTIIETPFRDLAQVRRDMEQLQGVVRLLLIGLIIATTSLCLFMYRQTKLLRFQILAQQHAVTEAYKQQEPLLGLLPLFQQIGGRYPDYTSNVLARFNLPSVAPTNAPPAPQR